MAQPMMGTVASISAPSPVPAVPPLVLQEASIEARHPEGAPDGRVFRLVDLAADPAGPPAATAVVSGAGAGTAELERFWTDPGLPRAVVTRRLVASLADALRAAGCRQLATTLPPGDSDQLRLLVEAGFEPAATGGCSEGVCLELAL